MSEAMPIVPKSWRLESGEEVLREERADRRLRDLGEGDNPWARALGLLLFGGFGAFLLYRQTTGVIEKGFEWWQLITFPMALGILYLGVMSLRKSEPSPWAQLDRYVFTNNRIALLNESGALLDDVRREDIDDVMLDKKLVVIWRKPDTGKFDSFNIAYTDQPDELFEFVRDTYT
ncbi:MAG: hypothetical protein QUV02_08425 [Maricaulis sp.]|uniref:hypothetical protein n=1 Tax=Maricaulis sp. TaxID=1486257 RepID=UPI0026379F19|nr:hypothetical protein [Maricaulis sp.]MDM7984464.1 hypothetical protein [Maricaulis sp.]